MGPLADFTHRPHRGGQPEGLTMLYRITERDTGCIVRVTRDLFTVGRYARHGDRYAVKGA